MIPAFNEEAGLLQLLSRTAESKLDFEIIVVDDGSDDQTGSIAAQAGVHVLRHACNLGYGAALQTGYKYAYRRGATLVVQMDADGQHDPREIASLIEPVEQGRADLVIGSRFLGAETYKTGRIRKFGWSLLNAVARVFGLRITDPTSGFQALNRKVLGLYIGDAFPADYPDLDVLLAAQRHGVRIEERPVLMSPASRPSTLHSGFAPVYYFYKMLLSIWAGYPEHVNTHTLVQPKQDAQ